MNEDFEWENALKQLNDLTDEALEDLVSKAQNILLKRRITARIGPEAFA